MIRRRAAEVNKPLCRRSQPIVSVDVYWLDATLCRRNPSTRRTADEVPTQTIDTTRRRRRDVLPTQSSADSNRRRPMWRTADEEVDQCWIVEVDPLKCRRSLTITTASHRRWMIFSDPRLHPTAYCLVWKKQDFLRTDFINLSVNCPVHTYAPSNQFVFFSSSFRCCELIQIREPFCSLSRRSHNSTSSVKCQLASRQKSASITRWFLKKFKSNFLLASRRCLTKVFAQPQTYIFRIPYRRHHVINESPCGDKLGNNDDVT